MTYRLLAFSLLFHVSWSCVPVRPGEDMPCPSAPEAATAPGYTKKPFTTTNEAGSKVLSCASPAMLVKVVGGVPTALPQNSKIICKPNSGKYVINDGTGDKEIGSETYTCGEPPMMCSCMNTPDVIFTDGMMGVCPPDRLCVPPKGDTCIAQCPPMSKPWYLNANMMPKEGTSITCKGTEWIEAGATEVTCTYDAGAGELTMPAGPCMKLDELVCPMDAGLGCQYGQLIYTPYKDGYRATCKTGKLLNDIDLVDTMDLVVDCPGTSGVWDGTITQATCATDDSAVQDCIDKLTGPGQATISCKLGACTLTCANPAQYFEYTEVGGNGALLKAKNLKCHDKQLVTTFLDPINFPPNCVN